MPHNLHASCAHMARHFASPAASPVDLTKKREKLSASCMLTKPDAIRKLSLDHKSMS